MSDENGWLRPDPAAEPPPPGTDSWLIGVPAPASDQVDPTDPWRTMPAEPLRRSRRVVVAAVIAVAVAVIGAAGVVGVRALGSLGESLASGDPFGEAPAGAGEAVPPGDLAVGDCYRMRAEDKDSESVGLVRLVGCAVPHDGQVFALPSLPFDDFPGDAEVRSTVETTCDEFATRVLDQSVFDDPGVYLAWFVPGDADWAPSGNTAACVVETDAADGLTRTWIGSTPTA
jgi:hypothetical protein